MIIMPEYVLKIISILDKQGYQAFLVGGCVRDILLSREPRDYDLATSASPTEIGRCFAKSFPIGARHGTVAVLMDGHHVEITTFRGKQPVHAAGDLTALAEDLARRDFTINAMAMDASGKLFDPWGGRRDLADKVLRAPNNQAEPRLAEDPLRMMRAVRLSTVYGLNITEDTQAAILRLTSLLEQVSRERVREELNRILVSEQPVQGVRMLQQFGLLSIIIPELELMVGVDQRNIRHDRDLFEHSLAVMEGVPARLKVRLAALLHDIGKPACFTIDEDGVGHFYGHHLAGISIAEDILYRLKYDQQTIHDVSLLVGAHMTRFGKLRDASLKKLVKHLGRHNLMDLYDLQRADILGSAPPYDFTELDEMKCEIEMVLSAKQPLEIQDLAVKGSDLITLGYHPGPALGEALNKLLELVLEDPEMNQTEGLLEKAREWL